MPPTAEPLTEWEYAYRAGSTFALYNGPITSCTEDEMASEIGWYLQNSPNGEQSSKVKEKPPNAWGLHDMAGNVWELCHDNFKKNLGPELSINPWGALSSNLGKVTRGGGFRSWAQSLRAAERTPFQAVQIADFVGFRCVRTVR